MLTESRFGRRTLGGAAVLLTCVLSVFATRGFEKTIPERSTDFRQKGEPQAPVVIVEFSDFQCPACQKAEEPVRSLLALYGKDVLFIFKHFPLERLHPWARSGAAAAECAGRQGRFWPYHDRLYDRQREWSEGSDAALWLLKYARETGLDEKAFQSCLKDPSVEAAIDADKKEGDDRFVGSTPTFFINHKRFAGALQLSSGGTLWIDKILASSRRGGK